MQFLRRARAKTLTSVEEVAVTRVCEAYSKVVTTCGSPGENWDFNDPEGATACTEFLQQIDKASMAMRVEAAARDYREDFTVNYQVLFPTDDRHYRLDILTACTEQYSGIWLNGEQYDFDEEVKQKAEALMQAWTELLKVIGSLEVGQGPQVSDNKEDRSKLKCVLRTFDETWAHFEHKYISGLIGIEDQAKKLIRDAIRQEGKLHEMERASTDSQSVQSGRKISNWQIDLERGKFVNCISRLNTVANTARRGRDDLTADILHHALMLWQVPEGIKRPMDRSEVGEEVFKKVKSTPGSAKSYGNNDVGEEVFRKVKSTPSSANSSGSERSSSKQARSILKSKKRVHPMDTSSKAVRFFPEGEDNDSCDDYTSNASTASTEDHHSSTELSSLSGQQEKQRQIDDKSGAQCLAGDVVESYWHIRYYLRDISNGLERIDPNLSSNSELVSRLEDWEESWEVGREYVCDSGMHQIVCELVSFLKEVEKLEPAFAEMTQECDAEFCLCLPRLVWLHFLQDPQKHMKLLQRFLPHHFTCSNEDSQSTWSSSIGDLLDRYEQAEHEVTQRSNRVADRRCSVHRFLVQSIIAGPNSDVQPEFSADLDNSDASALVHAIEERSMELQRHEPAAWNHFMMVIVRCFSQGQPKSRQRMGPKAPVPKMQPTRSRRSLWRNRPRLRTTPFPVVFSGLACLSGN